MLLAIQIFKHDLNISLHKFLRLCTFTVVFPDLCSNFSEGLLENRLTFLMKQALCIFVQNDFSEKK